LRVFFSEDGRSSNSDEIVLIVVAVVVVVVIVVVVVDNMSIAVAAAEADELLSAHLHLQRVIDCLVLRVSIHSQDIGNTQSTGRIGVMLTCHKEERSLLGAGISSILLLP
jgi:hypothetical protein